MLVLQALHIFWAVLIVRMVIKFLPGNVRTGAFSFPTTQHVHLQSSNCTDAVSRFTTQDIVEDERSDREETESEDEDVGREQRGKFQNGHVQNGHTLLNNNHSKVDWLDWESWRWGCVRRDDGPSHVALTWKPKNGSVACWERQRAATRTHTHTHFFTLLSETPVVQRGYFPLSVGYINLNGGGRLVENHNDLLST